jgi:tripartite ATP-independent transporter DctP family solute receptor
VTKFNLKLAVAFIALWVLPAPLAADYKAEFKMSVVVNEQTSWGRAANRFADAVRYRTQGRIQIKNYFGGRLFAGEQTTEFQLMQQGVADFAIGSTANWCPQVKELNLFLLPFMFSNYTELDAVEMGEPGKRLFRLIEQKGVVPLAWGENGFRELTNAKRRIRRPEDLHELKIRVPPIPILIETFQALGADPVSMNFGDALEAFRQGTVDGQENPVALIIPYKFWTVHKYLTLWHYTIDPIILAVSGKTWAGLNLEDQKVLRKAAEEIMAEQKNEAREGLEQTSTVVEKLQDMYEMEVFHPSPVDVERFRNKARPVYVKWTEEIGTELVRSVETIVKTAK